MGFKKEKFDQLTTNNQRLSTIRQSKIVHHQFPALLIPDFLHPDNLISRSPSSGCRPLVAGCSFLPKAHSIYRKPIPTTESASLLPKAHAFARIYMDPQPPNTHFQLKNSEKPVIFEKKSYRVLRSPAKISRFRKS